jgi:hypothetical protein
MRVQINYGITIVPVLFDLFNNFSVFSSHKCLRAIIIVFFVVIPAKAGHQVKASALSRWIQEVGFPDA